MSFSRNDLKDIGAAASAFLVRHNANVRLNIANRVVEALSARLETAQVAAEAASERKDVACKDFDEIVLRISTEGSASQESVAQSAETVAMSLVGLGMATLEDENETPEEVEVPVAAAAPRRRRRTKAEKEADDAAAAAAAAAATGGSAPEVVTPSPVVESLKPEEALEDKPSNPFEVASGQNDAAPEAGSSELSSPTSSQEEAQVTEAPLSTPENATENFVAGDEPPFDIAEPPAHSGGQETVESGDATEQSTPAETAPETEMSSDTVETNEGNVADGSEEPNASEADVPPVSIRRPAATMPRRPMAVRPIANR